MKILFQRKYAGYVYQRGLQSGKEYGCEDFEVIRCFTHEGDYIGSPTEARFLTVKRGLTCLQPPTQDCSVCTIGYSEEENKWYGWSHRAICGFGLGDKIFIERFGNDQTPFVKHGRTTITNMRQAKTAATRFAESVS